MKACEFWLDKVKGAADEVSLRRVIREIQSDALKGAGLFAFTEREATLALHLSAAAEALIAQGGDPTPVVM